MNTPIRNTGTNHTNTASLLDDNHWLQAREKPDLTTPLADQLFVQEWRRYQSLATDQSLMNVLKTPLRQLYFPIEAGMSGNSEYQAATKKGLSPLWMEKATGLALEDPEGIRLFFHSTEAGHLPVLDISSRSDFENLVRALARRNEPVEIPLSTGACMVKGYNNWDRVDQYKKQKGDAFDFQQMKEEPELYRDVFLLITQAPYSGVSATDMGLNHSEWLVYSRVIRLAHEATHYVTLRVYGSAKNHLLDEMLADYRGIVAALGEFKASWLLRFFGIRDDMTFRTGGRIKNYLKDQDLSDDDFKEVMEVAAQAAYQLEDWGRRYPEIYTREGQSSALDRLTRLTLRQMAAGTMLHEPPIPMTPTIHRSSIENSPPVACFNRETNKDTSCLLALLETQQLEEVMAFHDLIVSELQHPDLYIPDTRKELVRFMGQEFGFMLGLYDETGLQAFRTIIWPGEDAINLGHYLGLDRSQLKQVIQLQGTVIHPRYQGAGLQCLLTEKAIDFIKLPRSKGILLTAISPLNDISLMNMFTVGMHIAGLKDQHTQPVRLLLRKELFQQNRKWHKGPWVQAGDIESHRRMLSQGLEGYEAKMNDDKKLMVRYGRPLLSHDEGAVMR